MIGQSERPAARAAARVAASRAAGQSKSQAHRINLDSWTVRLLRCARSASASRILTRARAAGVRVSPAQQLRLRREAARLRLHPRLPLSAVPRWWRWRFIRLGVCHHVQPHRRRRARVARLHHAGRAERAHLQQTIEALHASLGHGVAAQRAPGVGCGGGDRACAQLAEGETGGQSLPGRVAPTYCCDMHTKIYNIYP